MGVEWLPEEVVELGPDRPPWRWSRRVPAALRGPRAILAMAVIAAAALVAGLVVTSHDARPPRPGAATAPASEQVELDQAVALIVAGARTSGPLHDYIRPDSTRGACALVPVGRSPTAEIGAAIARSLPGYAVRDSALTIDQFTALCAITVRAADRAGSVLMVAVTAPQAAARRSFTALTVGARTVEGGIASVATAVTTTGWSVTVGVVGPLADEPSSADLQRLSQYPALVW